MIWRGTFHSLFSLYEITVKYIYPSSITSDGQMKVDPATDKFEQSLAIQSDRAQALTNI